MPAIVRWPGHTEAGTESDVPIIGSDIFSTVLAIVGEELPSDRTIDGVNLIPALSGDKLERPVPLFWRTHIAPAKSHAAMRIDEWKLVVDKDLKVWQLYQIEEDWKEENDLAASNPEKLAEMKAKFMEVWDGVEEEGRPSEWWTGQDGGQKKRAGKLKDGKDTTGDWDVVKGGTVSKNDFGYALEADGGEAFALIELDEPVQEEATFRIRYRTAAAASTKNAFFAVGPLAENDRLHKAGSMLGMDAHGAFDGTWSNVKLGASKKVDMDRDATFEALIHVDLEHGKLTLEVDGVKVQHGLPYSLESLPFIGIYVKDTKSEFTMPERVE